MTNWSPPAPIMDDAHHTLSIALGTLASDDLDLNQCSQESNHKIDALKKDNDYHMYVKIEEHSIKEEPGLYSHFAENNDALSINSTCVSTHDYPISNRIDFEIHSQSHTMGKQFQCVQCNKSFTKKQYLKKHMIIHTGERPYKCNRCSKDFVEKGKLVRHQKVHTGEKSHQCSHCRKSFAAKYNLGAHQRMHTVQRNDTKDYL